MYIFICICIYIYIYVCIYIYMYMYIYICICAHGSQKHCALLEKKSQWEWYLYICTCVYIYIFMYIYIYIFIYLFIFMSLFGNIYICIYLYIYLYVYLYLYMYDVCSRFSVRCPLPQWYGTPSAKKNRSLACYLQHLRVTASHLHAMCSISEPQPLIRTLFAAFENHMLPTYNLRAVHKATYNIYMFLLFLEYLYTSHRISLYYSAVAYHVLPALYPYIEPIYYL